MKKVFRFLLVIGAFFGLSVSVFAADSDSAVENYRHCITHGPCRFEGHCEWL